MVFNSIPFLIFAIVFFALWNLMNKKSLSRWFFITIMSFIFYAWWDWRFLFLIIGSGLIDYCAGWFISLNKKGRTLFFILSLLGNLGALAVFKYSDFLAIGIDNVFNYLGNPIHLKEKIPDLSTVTVVGISFYTFQSMSYTIDIYRGRLAPTKNILHFFSYLAMFPQLVAGPIIRAKDLLGQLAQHRISTHIEKWNGIKLIVFGLFQKTVLADNIGIMVNKAYSAGNLETGTSFWIIVLIGFAFQIYCDFSGYSLMARGIAKYMGYHFKMNFNHPYLATSFKNFWSRWHISLSTWFRDYVYIPLGGSKKGLIAGLLFMTITMFISGLWHGAGLTFIYWGLLHAVFLIFERLTKWPKYLAQIPFGKILSTIVVFTFVVLSWNYFRSDSLDQATTIFENIFSFDVAGPFYKKYVNSLVFLLLAIIIELVYLVYIKNSRLKFFYKRNNIDVYFVTLALLMSLFFRGPAAEFIYFQF